MNAPDGTIARTADSTHVGASHDQDGERRAVRSRGVDELIALFAQAPELMTDRSFVIECAVDDFLDQLAQTPALTPKEYCQKFKSLTPSIRSSIYRQLEVEQYFHRQMSAGRPDGFRSLQPGDRIGSFEVLEKVGEGACATVYLCADENIARRQVIIKAGRASSSEAHTLGLLQHPNIVPIYAAPRDVSDDAAILCMPFLGRSTLCDVVDIAFENGAPQSGEPVFRASRHWEQPSDQVTETVGKGPIRYRRSYQDCIAYIGARLADALAHANERGVVHGDVKPSNVILSPQGEPLLVDFNLSGNAAYALQPLGGTLPYMPPEQLCRLAASDAQPSNYDARSDIFSLGVLLYELLCGRLPFPLDDVSEVSERAALLLRLQRQGCIPLRRSNPNVRPRLARIVERCLAWDPAERFQSPAELRDQLEADIRPIARLRRRVAAHRRKLAAAATIATLLLAAWLSWTWHRPPEEIRRFNRALELRERGDLAAAQAELRLAVHANPAFKPARFELARMELRHGRLDAALDGFSPLANEGDPCSAAYMGYCFSRKSAPLEAIAWYKKAIELGCQSGEVHNNLAVECQVADQGLDEQAKLALTKQHLELALARLPDSPTVRLNWVLYELHRVQLLGGPVSKRALTYADQLTAEFPSSGYVHDRSARLLSYASEAEPELLHKQMHFLRRAVELGRGPSPEVLLDNPRWAAVRAADGFNELLDEARQTRPRRRDSVSRRLEPTSCATWQFSGLDDR